MTTKRRPRAPQKRTPARERGPDQEWSLLLYVAGQSPRSLNAIDNLKKICDANLEGRYRIEVVDLLVHPERSKDDQIVALATLVRRLPAPIRKIIGDLSNTARTLTLLQVPAKSDTAPTAAT